MYGRYHLRRESLSQLRRKDALDPMNDCRVGLVMDDNCTDQLGERRERY